MSSPCSILDSDLDLGEDTSVAKVTGKYQLTLPKALAEAAGIRVGDELDFERHGERLELRPRVTSSPGGRSSAERLAHFDRATARHRRRTVPSAAARIAGRGWTREELYTRGRHR